MRLKVDHLRPRRWTVLSLLLTTTAIPALAQEIRIEEIVVTAQLESSALAERNLDEEDIAAHGASSVEDLINSVMSEEGDEEQPAILVNGQPVTDMNDIAGLPAEALRQLQIMPRGAGAQYGVAPERRVYNIVLRREFKTYTATVARRMSTGGAWGATRGEMIFTRIQGDSRLNANFRVRDEDSLLESDRDIIQPAQRLPFDMRGNIVADPRIPGNEIDPALSTLVGSAVSVAAVPGMSNPTLADFARGAGVPNITDLGDFRTLRPDTRTYDFNLSYTNRLARWLMMTASARVGYTENKSLSGLASGAFLLPPSNAASPFSRPVAIARYGDELDRRQRRLNGNANLGLNATWGEWRMNFNAQHSENLNKSATRRQVNAQAPILLADTLNPFATDLDPLLPVRLDHTRSHNNSSTIRDTLTGPPFRMPAGQARLTLEGRFSRSSIDTPNTQGALVTTSDLNRHETSVRTGLSLPITSRRNNFLAGFGEFSLNGDYSRIGYSDTPGTDRYTYGLSWAPIEAFRVNASTNVVHQPPDVDDLGDAVTVTSGVRILDILRNETVDVTESTGGNPGLAPQSTKTQRIGANIRPLSSLNLTLDYSTTTTRNLISNFPLESAPIWLAFPERFSRDANGRLTAVDLRPVNFSQQRQKRLRYGFNLNLTIGGGSGVRADAGPGAEMEFAGADLPIPPPMPPSENVPAPAANAQPSPPPAAQQGVGPPAQRTGGPQQGRGGRAGGPPSAGARGPGGGGPGGRGPGANRGTRVQLNASHTIILSNEILIRPGVAPVDMLAGGAIGIGGGGGGGGGPQVVVVGGDGGGFGGGGGSGGGRQRHQVDFSLAVTNRGLGLRVSGVYRGESLLQIRSGAGIDYLTFAPYTNLNATIFAEGQRLFPRTQWLRGTRVSLNLVNLTESRQRVTDSTSATPLRYQPGYRDSLGRTIELELRKQF